MKQLKWGQTPFDTLTQKELLLLTKKFFSALISAESTLEIIKTTDNKNNPFWKKGTGFRALEKLTQCTKNIMNEYDNENIYRSFYRYADDLLFKNIGFNWMVCDKCERMFGAYDNNKKQTCILCNNQLRPIEWKDLKPNEKQ